MHILTYSLLDGEANSDGFYQRAAELTDAFLLYGEEKLLPEARKLRRLAERTGAEPPRSVEEYAFDLLTAGVLWRVYRFHALGLSPARGRLLRRLAGVRTASPRLKPAADRLRATWGSRWLLVPAADGEARPPEAAVPGAPTAAQWQKLCLWLEATGEFNQEAARLRLAADCLAKAPPGAFRATAEAAVDAAAWLAGAGARMLGDYTRQVEDFRAGVAERTTRREDAVLRNRTRVEYHLNLLGAELMNRVYRSAFWAAPKHAVLLPVCLRAHSGQDCAAIRSGCGHTCLRCDKSCRVASVMEMGAAEGFEVILISHESDAFSHRLIDRLLREGTAIVGVACALNLVSGGLRAKAVGLAAQCVILDYCGCGRHWDDAGGFPTDLNLNRLQAILRPT
ncbi:DUF116 domain-containing protein [Paenibacillus sp. YN15]|uniref:DUF116 domain-containing protein n=1 Tax=Paenibacillus sp. YN15 TaxID=1742774 RepID=UPI000DCD4F3C|nr:DUF116 domain-containing protein [Paenibacillus sp. YN15]RAU94919.1 hypothetical protein DQG13_23165 [Paenibacillus sp. YN15]